MGLYTFYFDESFHDRKILVNDKGCLNALREDALENYVGVFWGCKQADLKLNKEILYRFEQRQKKRFGLEKSQELKSTVISRKNYKYGIHSFNKNAMSFYKELFETIEIIKPIIQINTISKIEFFMRKLFEHTVIPGRGTEDFFFYSITKFLIHYHNPELLCALYNAKNRETIEGFQRILIQHLKCIVKEIKGISRKEKEKEALVQLISILSEMKMEMDEKKKYDFAYFINFDGLTNLLKELNVDVETVRIIIDREENTYSNALGYSFENVTQKDSKECIQLRLCDWLSGFIGQMMYGIFHDEMMLEDSVEDIRKIAENDLERKRLLSKEWFDLSEEQFGLYQYICEVLIAQHQYYWTIMTLNYGDAAASFSSLFKYVKGYESYEAFKMISLEQHTEYYNRCCCEAISEHYNL